MRQIQPPSGRAFTRESSASRQQYTRMHRWKRWHRRGAHTNIGMRLEQQPHILPHKTLVVNNESANEYFLSVLV